MGREVLRTGAIRVRERTEERRVARRRRLPPVDVAVEALSERNSQ
ncbi:MAG TPA: hypothetical protein VNG11_05955 [Chloroflexota bacterium]|nr:hypothetical protein [Chloroflexota bacterium]